MSTNEVESPTAPAASDSSSRWHIAASSSAVATRWFAASPITNMRITL